jgi:glutathione S-transferase
MPDLILYHYDLSPFAEKIRLMMGYTGLPWKSVKVLEMPPRPVIEILAGGYRKIPVMQMGADIYCDTKTITTEIARLSGKPELALENCAEDVNAFVQKTDGAVVFMAMITADVGPGALLLMVKRTSFLRTLCFIKDRVGVTRKSKMKNISAKESKEIVYKHLDEMECLLKKNFLFGDKPCVADFSAFHSLNLAVELKGMQWLEKWPKVVAWFKRVQAFGHGASTELTDDQALDIAHNAEPLKLREHAVAAQKKVSIEPDDYARDPTAGLLIGEHDRGWVIAREHPRIGKVHVHFPKAGYSFKEQV